MPRTVTNIPPAIDERLAKELERYRGKWVAIVGERVVGVGGSAAEAIAEALKAGETDPVVFRVPVDPERKRL